MEGLILAGGFGTRLGPIGQEMPKALIMIENKPVLDHLLERLAAVNIKPFIVVNEKFEKYFDSYDKVIVEETRVNEKKPGAVSAIYEIIQHQEIEEDLFVLASDNFFSQGFEDFLEHYTGDPLIGVYYIGSIPELDPREMGTLKFEGCNQYPPPKRCFKITGFREKSDEPTSDYIGTGAYLLPKKAFPIIKEFCEGKRRDNLGTLIEFFLEKGIEVLGYRFSGEWQDVSSRSYLEEFGEGKLVKSDDRYIVVDREVGGLVFSITILHAGMATTGHSHDDAGEVYFFAEGKGILELDGEKRTVKGGDAFPIMPGQFHRVYNNSERDLVFLCAFEKYGERG